MGYIYKIENEINGKIYIGKTEKVNPYNRFKEHISDSKKDKYKNRPLYRAFNKYGIEHFKFDVIAKTDTDLEEMEKYYIGKYSSFGRNGYNATKGGDGKSYLNLDDNEVCNYHMNIAEYHLHKTSNHFGVDRNTIIKILDRNQITWISRAEICAERSFKKTDGICQVDPETFNIIKIFRTPADANRFLNKNSKNTNIRTVAFAERKYGKAFGFYWCSKKEYDDYIRHLKEIKNREQKTKGESDVK